MSDDIPPGVVLPDAPDLEWCIAEVQRLSQRERDLVRLAYAVVGGWVATQDGLQRPTAQDVLDTLYPRACALLPVAK